MVQFYFDIAGSEDDRALRAILRDNPMEGDISLSFQREPNYFQAVKVEGCFNQVVVCREKESRSIVGFGTRSIKPVFVNGELQDIGYLSNLRLNKASRGGSLVARAYQYMKRLNQDGKAVLSLSTIMGDNEYAKRILTGKRAGLPAYHDYGEYHTYIISLRGKCKRVPEKLEIVKGSKYLTGKIVDFMHDEGRAKQFYPFYTREEFVAPVERLRGFRVEDFYVALENNRIIGVLAKWDQSSYKQTIVSEYSNKIKHLRPFYNVYADLTGRPFLPPEKHALRYFRVSFIVTLANNPDVFRSLLNTIYNDHLGSNYAYLMIGLHSDDPLSRAVEEYKHVKIKSRLYIVDFNVGVDSRKILDGRIPYLEIGTL